MSTRWDPFRDLITLQEHLNRIFDASVSEHRHREGLAGWHPPSDVCETGEEIHLLVELAGMSSEDFDLRIEKNKLILKGERRPLRTTGEYHQSEILIGPFHRVFQLPSNVDPAGIEARYRDGILEIILPKVDKPDHQNVPIKVK
ncbi:MAG: Hsp20/alpha crystallin family protein [bacterium]